MDLLNKQRLHQAWPRRRKVRYLSEERQSLLFLETLSQLVQLG